MAYAATVTQTLLQISGEGYVVVTIVETGVTGATDETEIPGLPKIGTVTEVHSALTADGGTATTVDPQIGEDTNSNSVYENATAGATTHSGTVNKVYTVLDGTLFWRAKANGTIGAAGDITSQITIKAGHHP